MIPAINVLANPKAWKSARYKYLASTSKGRLPPAGDQKCIDSESSVPYLSMEYLRGDAEATTFVDHKGLVIARDKDVLLLWDGSNAGEFLRAKYGVVSSTAALVEVTAIDRDYLFWISKAIEPVLRMYTNGMGIPHVDGDFLRNLRLLTPDPSIQREIADYLDRETARIDALVTEKESMLALLEEKRAVLISRAVTRGLDHDAPLKSSGLDWLGEIPAHWSIYRFKFLAKSLDQGASPQAANTPAELDEYGILKLSAVARGHFKRAENKALRESDCCDHVLSLRQGDVLITRGNTPELVADACFVPQDEPNLLLPDLIYRLRVQNKKVLPQFLTYFLITPAARTQIQRDARGSSGSMVKVSQGHVLDWVMPLPPVDEQARILSRIEAGEIKLQAIIDGLSESIDLLKERRAVLITAAVTGQIQMQKMTT